MKTVTMKTKTILAAALVSALAFTSAALRTSLPPKPKPSPRKGLSTVCQS